MYHYVREYNSSHPNFRFLEFSNFQRQLDFFEKNYGYVSKEEWNSFVSFGVMPNISGKVILTFDDSLSCHYDYAFHELKKRGLWAIFYIPMLPYLQQKLLDVHRIHLLCGAFDGVSLLMEARALITEDMVPDLQRYEFRALTYSRQNNSESVTEFKRLFNYYLDHNLKSSVIDDLAKIFNYKFNPSNFYISEENLKDMAQHGMIIGSHSVTHNVMSKLTLQEQSDEIITSLNALTDMGIGKEKTFCHPYGGFHSFNQNTINLLHEHNVSFSFNVEPREILATDFKESKQFLPRFDCNLFEFGKIS